VGGFSFAALCNLAVTNYDNSGGGALAILIAWRNIAMRL